MENKNNTYFVGGAGDETRCFVECGITSGNYTATIRKNGNGNRVGDILLFKLIGELEKRITDARTKMTEEKELTQ